MRILLGSGGYRTPERVTLFTQELRSFLGDIPQVLFVPYALQDHDRYVDLMKERGLHGGYDILGIHRCPDPVAAIRSAEAILVGGGNTFRLLDCLYRFQLLDPIRERVCGGMPYIGISAGTNVAGPTIMTTNDMPIVQPPSFQALGLVSFQINPHYINGQMFVKRDEVLHEHFGETRDERIREFHELNDTPVLGLWEASLLRLDGNDMALSAAPARLFRKGQEPLDLQPGVRGLEILLKDGKAKP